MWLSMLAVAPAAWLAPPPFGTIVAPPTRTQPLIMAGWQFGQPQAKKDKPQQRKEPQTEEERLEMEEELLSSESAMVAFVVAEMRTFAFTKTC